MNKNLKISKNLDEETLRKLHLRRIALGEIQGPITGYASKDMPWLKYYSEEAICTDLPEMSVYNYLKQCNADRLDTIALEYMGRKITYKELFNNIEKTAKMFRKMGIEKGDIVTVTAIMVPEIVYTFYALNKLGAVSNMVDPRSKKLVMEHYINEVNSKYYVMLDACYVNLKDVIPNTGIKKTIVFSPSISLPPVVKYLYKLKNKSKIKYNDKMISWEREFNRDFSDINVYENSSYNINDVVSIAHTGGTTGVPKGVQLTDYNFNALTKQYEVSGIPLNPGESWLGVIPPFVAYGSGTGMHLPLCRGMNLKLVPTFGANDFDKLVYKYKANHMAIVPSYFNSIINSKKLKNMDLSFIIAPTVGGDAMDQAFEKNINDFLASHNCKYKISKGYGMTEGSSGVSVTVSDDCNEYGCVGIPLVKNIIAAFDPETMEEVSLGQKGEICICTPNMMKGYYNNPKETDKIIIEHKDGLKWIHSGDRGYLTKDGIIHIEGRIKRMIIDHDGFKIFPSNVESIILQNDKISQAAVIGVPDLQNGKGFCPMAFIVLKDEFKHCNIEEIKREINDICAANLPEYSLPFDFIQQDVLPVTNIGKVDFRKLEEIGAKINEECAKPVWKQQTKA